MSGSAGKPRPHKLSLMTATAAGFAGVATVWEEPREEHWTRVCMHAVPREIDRERLLPRKPRLMSVRGGDRGRGRRAAG